MSYGMMDKCDEFAFWNHLVRLLGGMDSEQRGDREGSALGVILWKRNLTR